MHIVVLDPVSGAVLQSFEGSDEVVQASVPQGATTVPGPALGDWYTDDWHTKPTQPGPSYAWDWATYQWVDTRTLQDLRDVAHAAIEHWRDVQENTAITFDYDGHTWDGGLVTRQRLMPVLSLPALPPGFFWTDADNNDVPMTLSELQDLAGAHEVAIVTRGFAIHVRQREMKEEILTMTAEQLAAFVPDWPPEEP